jgi:hypothetical protein
MNSRTRFYIRLGFLVTGFPCLADAQQPEQPQETVAQTRKPLAKPTQTAQALTDTKVTDSLRPLPVRRLPVKRNRFSFENAVTNVYDTNIDHDSTNLGSYGIVVGGNGRFRSLGSRPGLQLEYGIAVHQYTATDRWDRVSQIGRAGVDAPLGKHLLFGVTGEIFLKGSSEDREIGDQYAVLPRIEIRPTDNTRFRVITAYRKRYYGESSGSNATNRYVTFDSRIRLNGGTLEGAARFEENLPKLTRLRFQRQTFTGRYGWDVGDRGQLIAGVEYRPVRYPERTVDIEDDEGETIREEVRRDTRWKPNLIWLRQWTQKFRTDLEYEYEWRLSNDPDKHYRGHVLSLTTAVLW